jgi:1-acyl-sn-glycerol-3-phosphate acyltransferase
MWFILNIIQSIFILVWSIFLILLVFITLIFKQRNAAFFIVEKLWSPVLLIIVGARISSINRDKATNLKEPVIFASNHQSNFDITSIINQTPRHLHFIAKQEIKKVPFLGQYTAAMGMIFIDRKNKLKAKESLQKAGELIRSGRDVVVFPEGTRSKDGNIQQFKRGAFILAKEGKVNIVPVAIKGTRKINPSGKFRLRPGKVVFMYGDLILSEDFLNKTVEEFATHVQGEVEKLFNTIK